MNKNLSFTIKFNVDNTSLRRVQRSVEDSVLRTSRLGEKAKAFDENVKRATTSIDKMKQKLKDSNSAASKLLGSMRRLAAVYLGKMGLDALIETTDKLTSAQNKLNYINAQNFGSAGVTTGPNGREVYSDKTFNATAQSMEKIFNAANESRMSYTDMAENVGKSLTLAGSAFDNNIDKAIKFQKIMSEAYTIGGASAQQKSSSMYQLIQALGSGRLQGDELKSVAEGAQVAYHQIEKYAQALYGTTDSIKEMGSKGLLTADVVVDAIMGVEDEMESAFQKTTMTFEQAKTRITNEATRAFQPLMQKMTDWLSSDRGQKAINILIDLLYKLAHVLEKVMDMVIKIMNYVIDHEGTVRKAIGGITALLAGRTVASLVSIGKELKVVTGLTNFLVDAGFLHTASAIDTVATSIGGIASAAGGVLVALAPVLVAIGGIVAVCWIFSDSLEDFLGKLAGTFYAIGMAIIDVFAIVGNMFAGLITAGADLVVWFLQTMKTYFFNALADIENRFLRMFDFASGILLKIANGLNSIGIGINTDALEKFNKKVSKRKEYREYTAKVDFSNVDAAAQTFKVHDPDETYKKGYDWGYNILGKGKDTSSVLDTTLGTLDDYISNAVGDTSAGVDPTDKAIKDTADNTGDIASQLANTKEDLSYLRKIAELEWKRDYTNYNIEIAMTNNNTITKEADVDQITHALNAKLSEVAGNSASGLHY